MPEPIPQPRRAERPPAPEAKTAKRPRKPRRIVWAIILTLVLGASAGGWYLLSNISSGEQEGPMIPDRMGPVYQFDAMIVNVARTGASRYLKARISVELDGQPGLKEVEGKAVMLRDIILDILAGKTLDYLETVRSRDALRSEIMDTINSHLRRGRVVRVYFQEFVVQ